MNTSQIRTAHNYIGDLTIETLQDFEERINKLEKNMDKLLLLLFMKLYT